MTRAEYDAYLKEAGH